MSPLQLTQIQVANLNMLMIVVEFARRDLAMACSRFAIDTDQADFLAALDTQEILRLVTHIGDECLFPPRPDLIQVLSWPPELAGALLLVHPAQQRRPQALHEPLLGKTAPEMG